MVYEDNIRKFIETVGKDIQLKRDIELFVTTKGNVIGRTLIFELENHMLLVDDLTKIIPKLKLDRIKPEPKPHTEEIAIIKNKEKLTPDILNTVNWDIVLEDTEDTTGVWRLINRASKRKSNYYPYNTGKNISRLSHILAIRWDRADKGKDERGTGILSVAFRDGGRVSNTSIPVYSYSPVSYDQYYELWKRIGSPGWYVYKRWAQGGSNTGTYVGQVQLSKIISDARRGKNK